MRRRVALVVLMLAMAPSIALIYSVVSRTPSPVLRTVAAAAYPGAVAFDPMSGRAVVAGNSGEVSLLDTRSGDVLRTLPGRTILGGANVAIDAGAGRAIVCDFAGRVRALDTRTAAPVWGLTVGRGLSDVAVDDRRGRAYVVNPASPVVRVLDTRSGRLQRTIALGQTPVEVATDPATGHVFVTWGGDKMSTLDGATGRVLYTATKILGLRLVVSAATGHVFVVDESRDMVGVFDARTGFSINRVRVGRGPIAVAVDDGAKRVFVANQLSKTVSVLDAISGAVRKTVSVEVEPIALTVDDRTDRVLVVGVDNPMNKLGTKNTIAQILYSFEYQRGLNGAVSVLDARDGHVVQTVRVGQFPNAVAVDERAGRALVTNNDNVSLLDTRALR